MENISTFEQIPEALNILMKKIDFMSMEIQTIKDEQKKTPEQKKNIEDDGYITVKEVCELTHMKKASIYDLTYQKKIPYVKRGKLLYFNRKEILEWMASGKSKSEEQSHGYFTLRKFGKRK